MKKIQLRIFLVFSLLCYANQIWSQSHVVKRKTQTDVTRDSIPSNKKKTKRFFSNIFNRAKSAVFVSKQDSINKATVINAKAVVPFIEFQGKIIRSIKTTEYTFDRIFTDTTTRINHFGTKVLNALHTQTNGWVIRDNLFFKQGDSLNPYLISDNERHLRSLQFIQDARIVVKNVKGSFDSVDLEVITKDYFSITGSLDFSGVNRQKINVAENNLAGAGQRVQLTMLHDKDRVSNYGFDFQYSKTSIAHSFITGTVGFSGINSDPTSANNIQTVYLQLNRPLISPYSKVAGAFNIDFNKSRNTYNKVDTAFYKYSNMNSDVWIGYNFGVKKLLQSDRFRNRTFVSLRYINRYFYSNPFQVGNNYNSFFNPRKAVLGEVTFFRQEFYKTNYIYGFGTTEDVPYGYNIAATAGWYQQLKLSRPYFGINANFYSVSDNKGLRQYYVRNGFFLHNGHMEDISLMLGGSMFSRLHYFKGFKMRQYVKFNFSRIFGRTVLDPLQINNPLGLRYFSADTLKGTQRLSVYTESFFFAKYKIIGFLLAPFVFVDASMLKGEGKPFFSSDIYTGLGGGIRTRNVNLVFGTAELRAIYFPRKAQYSNAFVISFTAEIKFRYNTNYIRPPDIIQLNSEDVGSFY